MNPVEGAPSITLSICISTFNRAGFIGETLDSILSQLVDGTELVVVDGGSTDGTRTILEEYSSRSPRLRYIPLKVNGGLDADFNFAIEQARGTYCWLMSDDDLFCHDAIAKVMKALEGKWDAVVVNYAVYSKYFERCLASRKIEIDSDTRYFRHELDGFFKDTTAALSYLGALVIRRQLWMSRDRERFFGSYFVHLGVLFQGLPDSGYLAIAEPLIKVRYGNAQWTHRSFEIWMFKWPEVLWGAVGVSPEAKQSVCPREPWRQLTRLATLKALGAYSISEYQKFFRLPARPIRDRFWAYIVAMAPGMVVNSLALLYYHFRRTDSVTLLDLRQSRYCWTQVVRRLAPSAM